MISFEFSKYSGCGNDFILIDNRSAFFNTQNAPLIQRLCARRTGIGADGVIFLENSRQYDFKMRIFNADGYEAEMCGNGIRCLMKFIQDCGIRKSTCTIETFLRPLQVSLAGELVSVEMGSPFDFRWDLDVEIEGQVYRVHHINTGVPHLIHFCEDIDQFELASMGPKFRHHHQFAPQGANMNVVQLMPNGELHNRTFERGVEQETLACGTGCTAAAIAAHKIFGLPSPITVHTLSEESLKITFAEENGAVVGLTQTGPAIKIFQGKWPA